jgi:hypothetical protein
VEEFVDVQVTTNQLTKVLEKEKERELDRVPPQAAVR